MVQQTNNSSVCAALLAESEISRTIDLSADRGREAVETEWVVLVWAMMLVHDDWSQACLLTTHQMTNSVGERANAGLWCVRLSPGDAHPGCKFDTYCIGKVFISSQLWGHYAYLTTAKRVFTWDGNYVVFFYIRTDLIHQCLRINGKARRPAVELLKLFDGWEMAVLVHMSLLSLVGVFWAR